jgi:peptide/nickel transport system ATP-binding protein
VTATASRDCLVGIEGLTVSVPHGDGTVNAVRNVSFEIAPGEAVGLVGESGSGKTLTCRAILGILPPGCEVASGRISFAAKDLAHLSRAEWQRLHGRTIGAVFQDPGSYLNPSISVGEQLAEVLRVKLGMRRRAAKARAVELLDSLGLRDPERVYTQLPGELSGGMLQRALIAIAIGCDPTLLIADEPTTALDVTIQAEIVELLGQLRDGGLAILFVSHDLPLVAGLCDRIVVFYAGEVVEMGNAKDVMARPLHPYAQALLGIAAASAAGGSGHDALPLIAGRPPHPDEIDVGCPFAARCEYAMPDCLARDVQLAELEPGRWVRCVVRQAAMAAGSARG